MPTYQYACTECDHAFEQFQSFHEDSLSVCPRCEGRLRKVFNAVGVVFKGSGFYRTDSRSDAKSTAAAASSSPSGSGSGERQRHGGQRHDGQQHGGQRHGVLEQQRVHDHRRRLTARQPCGRRPTNGRRLS